MPRLMWSQSEKKREMVLGIGGRALNSIAYMQHFVAASTN